MTLEAGPPIHPGDAAADTTFYQTETLQALKTEFKLTPPLLKLLTLTLSFFKCLT